MSENNNQNINLMRSNNNNNNNRLFEQIHSRIMTFNKLPQNLRIDTNISLLPDLKQKKIAVAYFFIYVLVAMFKSDSVVILEELQFVRTILQIY